MKIGCVVSKKFGSHHYLGYSCQPLPDSRFSLPLHGPTALKLAASVAAAAELTLGLGRNGKPGEESRGQ
jgi:hypothetical protein